MSDISLTYRSNDVRLWLVVIAIIFSMAILIFRLWTIQVRDAELYREKAENNRIWPQRLKADRGKILAQDGTILADNRPSTDVVFVPGDCPVNQQKDVAKTLESIINVPASWILEQIDNFKSEPFTQIVIKKDIARSDWIRIEENSFRLPGVYLTLQPQRRYPMGSVAGQIMGYLNEINKDELDILEGEYFPGDVIGRSGLERYYERWLHGKDGYMTVTKYASGRPQLRTDRYGNLVLARKDSRGHLLYEETELRQKSISGKDLVLTLDIELQKFCEQILANQQGSIVVLNADTGAVLAIASSPGYDPNVFVTKGKDAERIELLESKDPNRMTNRAISEQYPPGSVFKVFLAATALEKGVITPTTTFFCPGSFRIGGTGREWKCWNKYGHGSVNVVEALAYSCDVFFYNVGLKLGVDTISEYAHKIGLGVQTGIDLPNEVTGLIPSREWKAKVNAHKPIWEQKWYPGDTVNLSIGQGSCATTPLQNAVLMATIINGGHRVYPHLNKDFQIPDAQEQIFSKKALESVIEGMKLCVEPSGTHRAGTGKSAKVEGITVIGKTGSAQIMSLEHHKKYKSEEEIPWEMRDHAWFIAGVLNKEPKIALCVLIEHGHHGASAAAPVAKQVIEFFYTRDAKKQEPQLIAREETGDQQN
ncbi:MAG TPA: penicillin-binding protein 2 [Candidatus Hydrogenedens sp.]|nr:penicillin-binding protein 2 [Candidatus Hydrogenedens sp.]HOL20311.1 penicillin-binding protein 2 [Candidatus Hydrogenedens sp.]